MPNDIVVVLFIIITYTYQQRCHVFRVEVPPRIQLAPELVVALRHGTLHPSLAAIHQIESLLEDPYHDTLLPQNIQTPG
jgi:hypothetical protein